MLEEVGRVQSPIWQVVLRVCVCVACRHFKRRHRKRRVVQRRLVDALAAAMPPGGESGAQHSEGRGWGALGMGNRGWVW